MKLIVKYSYLDEHQTVNEIVPINFTTPKYFLECFKPLVKAASDPTFYFLGRSWDADDYLDEDLEYESPVVLTIDEWFKDVPVYDSDGIS